MVHAYLGLGSNVGDRVAQLEEAIRLLNEADNVTVTQRSSIYETEPVGYVDQPQFLNQCVEVETSLTPNALLEVCQYIEQQLHLSLIHI